MSKFEVPPPHAATSPRRNTRAVRRTQAHAFLKPTPSRPRPNWARGLSLCTFALIFTALLAAVASADPDTRGGFGAGPANGQIVRSSPVGSIPGELAVGANGAASWSTPLEFLGEVGDTGMGLSVGQGDGEAKITGPGLISRCLDTTAFEGIRQGSPSTTKTAFATEPSASS